MNIESYANKHPLIDKSVYMHHTSCIIGDVTIGSNSSVWPYTVIRGDVEAITIGKNTNIQDGSIIHVTHAGPYTDQGQATTIGDDVTIGHRATLHACTVESATFIGINSTILDKAIIKTGAMLGANSLVTMGQEIEGGYLWLGQPARKIRALTQQELDYIIYSAKHYTKIANQYKNP